MRSLAYEFATQRNATPTRHESWDSPGPWDGPRHAPVARVTPATPVALAVPADVGPTRRAVLRRALRMGLLRPAARLRDARDASRSGSTIARLRSSRLGEAGKADASTGASGLQARERGAQGPTQSSVVQARQPPAPTRT